LPLSERLSKASKIVFSDKISNRDKNRGKVEAEVKAQKVNKAVEKPRKSVSGKTKPGLSTEQKDVFRRMGVPLKNHKKYGKL